ncbi:hypothetical protein [Microvirga mediterraneensis]|uniref:Uncharacterized protein n=1 Tax=Microvirga mediterraneensis TaxID=2754695 RepID=A0A838BR10_9HYPH|nr:hypothetical protein [Microvirga mediterraneensis]MBA1157967.1 hypothetical protein [Microvirga mediterraneensis]
MTKPLESKALARAYQDGIEQGLKLAAERMSAYLEHLSGDPHSYISEVIAGRLTGEMVAERMEFAEPVADESQVVH